MESTYNIKYLKRFRRRNAKLYAIYKMFSWDLLFYYSIEFLFFTIVKKLTATDILIIEGFYLAFKTLMQIPAVVITDFLGKRKSIIFGNILWIIHMIILIYMPGAGSVIISNMFFALGDSIKTIAEPNLLYDSVATKGGDGLYTKIDSRGGSFYYILDGVASLTAGYLFVINNYLPMYICFAFIVISTVLSFGFKDIYEIKDKQREEVGKKARNKNKK